MSVFRVSNANFEFCFVIYEVVLESTDFTRNMTNFFKLSQFSRGVCSKRYSKWAIHLSLHLNCHRQVIFCKLNLKIECPPPYAREVWHYGKAQTGLINRAID